MSFKGDPFPMPFGFVFFNQYLAQFRWLRDQYLMQHLRVDLDGCALTAPDGAVLGYLEEIRLKQDRLLLRGWARVQSATFRLGPTVRQYRPHEDRMDVSAALGCEPQVGFTTSLPFSDGPLQMDLLDHDARMVFVTHQIDVAQARGRADRELRRTFWRELLPLMPMILRGVVRRDPDLRRRIKTALRLDRAAEAVLLDAAFVAEPAGDAAVLPAAAEPITIILPVFNAFDLLPEVLRRIERHTDLPWHLIVIEDASPDPRVRPFLREWVARQPAGRVTLHENKVNQGFIRNVNLGLAETQDSQRGGPVVLLNSDALVPPAWASRLTAPLRDAAVASVTPLSNDAEIFSVPVICKQSDLSPGQGDLIDAALRATITCTQETRVVVPTGVGFCMAMGRDWIDRVGNFDTVFGRGYGEEVDWCRRCSASGARHVTAVGLFVEHRGGQSFGADKQALVQRNNAVISARYPDYDRNIQEFIRADPLITPRLVAALAWADSDPDIAEIPVFIAHSMGGGAEAWLRDRVAGYRVALTLRFGGTLRCQIELDTGAGRTVAETDDMALVIRLIGGVSKRRIIYSCAVGDPSLTDMPGFLLGLSEGAPLDVLFHDYLPLSPSYTLLDHDGVYRGVPVPHRKDPAHVYRGADGDHVPLAVWQDLWGTTLMRADNLVVFSNASAAIVAAAYPAAASRIVVRPHRITRKIARLDPPTGTRQVIGVLGAIGPQKGAAVVSALSGMVEGRTDAGLVLIGYIAPGYVLGAGTVVHGRYDAEDIGTLAQHYGITHWLIPSIWPETFSYTVHECLATGLPTLAFDLGAQGDAVASAPNGRLLALAADTREAEIHGRTILDAVLCVPA